MLKGGSISCGFLRIAEHQIRGILSRMIELSTTTDGDNRVYWITGLSGAGKSTLCRRLASHLEEQGRSVIVLDGDEMREVMGAVDAHGREERQRLAMRYAQLCRLLAAQGFDVAIATISLFAEVHEWNRAHLPGYVEIFVDIPLDELARRDPKGIYARAASGDLRNVAGLDLAVDLPAAPDVLLRWREGWTEDAAFAELLDKLKSLDSRHAN